MYPEIEPHDQGLLDVGDGNHVYWEVCGNPRGKPALVVHGGPGGGCTPTSRRFCDPERYRIVLFDQRNCGRSTPSAARFDTDLSTNTTEHLLADMERLREHLGVERWLLLGGSWGSTLALVYAQRFPSRVSEIVLSAVTTTRRSEIDWLYRGVGPLFPEEWHRFRAGVPAAERDDLVGAYRRLLNAPDPAVRERAAADWCAWELAVMTPDPDEPVHPDWSSPTFRMEFARLVTHYFDHGAWLAEEQVLRDAGALAGIPGVLVHGRLDLAAPLRAAWELARAWPDAELVVVAGAGHSSRDDRMARALVAATDRFAGPAR